ncbi:hypothetical protein BDZ97DRAFT_1874943 [Flammula alnicola]|nr:hypothetical protein BDZ97DRAFT_1874943 [Flammula alnicola]
MKFSIAPFAASLAFISQAFATPNPQSQPPTSQRCTPNSDILPCPVGYHCCPPIPPASTVLGLCLFNGANCPIPPPL